MKFRDEIPRTTRRHLPRARWPEIRKSCQIDLSQMGGLRFPQMWRRQAPQDVARWRRRLWYLTLCFRVANHPGASWGMTYDLGRGGDDLGVRTLSTLDLER